METEYISIVDFCTGYEIDTSFIADLQESGLLQIITEDAGRFIASEHLPRLEKMVRFHYEMHINLEGIEAIMHLLDQVQQLREEIQHLQNKLKHYSE